MFRLWKNFRRTVGLTALLTAMAVVSTACAPQPWQAGERGPVGRVGAGVAKPGVKINREELEQRIHQLVNQERAKHGLGPLAWNPVLTQIARQHSQDMARRHYFAHNSPEGHDLAYRFARQGFVCQVNAGKTVYMGSENIYETSLYESIDYVNEVPTAYQWKDLETIAQTVVRGWMKSPAHRQGILEPAWLTQGIGIAVSDDYRAYVTQDFC